MGKMHSVKGFVSGRVQAVGFRYFVMRHAQAEQVCGYARNLPDGRVEFFLQGAPETVAAVLEKIRLGPSHSSVTNLVFEEMAESPVTSEFVIR